MRRIVLLAALFALVAPARAAQSPAERGAASVATSALLALAPDRATIAMATQLAPTASVYVITATATGSGSISPSGPSGGPGADQTFTMTPLTCALVDNVRVDGSDLGPLTTYTFHDVSGSRSLVPRTECRGLGRPRRPRRASPRRPLRCASRGRTERA
jgi:hypothetical protein